VPEAHVTVARNSSNHKDGREKGKRKGNRCHPKRVKADSRRSQVKHLGSGSTVLDVEA